MNKRAIDKIIEIKNYLEKLESVLPQNFEEYGSDWKLRDICERRFEKIIGAVLDLTFIIIKEKGLKMPEDEENAFDILLFNRIISNNLCIKLKNAKSMRNIIAHEYGKIDDFIVFNAITEELIKDVEEFLNILG